MRRLQFLLLLLLGAHPACAAVAAEARPSVPVDLATDPAGLRVLPGFQVERLYSVPRKSQGSWVSLTTDPTGRLIVCDEKGHLYRVTPAALGNSGIEGIERIDVQLGGAQGLLYAFDSLYVMVNEGKEYASGLYRVRDTDGDAKFDSVEMLQKLQDRGEHGPHAIVLAPDGKSLFVIAGNITDLPPNVATYRVPKTWQEDLLLPRNPAPTGHNTGRLAPGGWVCQVSPDGKKWDLIATGFRNPYDLAFNRDGELFTFDADMEHDIGTPWYRPTRVCHVVSGAEFGWRFGTGKWPSYNADSVPPTLDVGLGSPTGVCFGYGSGFPPKYRDALFISDWTHGRLFAVHLDSQGASYSGELEEFVSGVPLPLTDVVVNPLDGAMYFTIGGRKTQSGLYRVTWVGKDIDPASAPPSKRNPLRDLRRQLESLHAAPSSGSLDFIWQHLGHRDRFVRYAARIALEHHDPHQWPSRLSSEDPAETTISALLAAARLELKSVDDTCRIFTRLWKSSLSNRQRVDLLRVLAVTFSRQGTPDQETRQRLADCIATGFPTRTSPLDFELCKMLVYLDSPVVVQRSLQLMHSTKTQEALLNYAMSLRVAKSGWTDELREDYLQLLNNAEEQTATGELVGGGHLQVYLQQIRSDAKERMSPAEQAQFADLLNPKIAAARATGSPTPRKFVKRWTVEDLTPSLDRVDSQRDFSRGKRLFTDASCIACHRFNGQGGIFGPDLTAVAKRYSRPVLLREIITPSVQVSDQYQSHIILTDAGMAHAGRIIDRGQQLWTVAVDPKQPASVIQIPANEIEQVSVSTVSMMPQNLLDTLSKNEVLDLLAYLESAGDPNYKAFQQE